MSINAENVTNASKQSNAEESNANNDRVLQELIDERMRANLEPFYEQISNLTQLLNQLINDTPSKTPMASSR